MQRLSCRWAKVPTNGGIQYKLTLTDSTVISCLVERTDNAKTFLKYETKLEIKQVPLGFSVLHSFKVGRMGGERIGDT
jgi:hypothetical protein